MQQRGSISGAGGVAMTAIALKPSRNPKTAESRGIDGPATPLARG